MFHTKIPFYLITKDFQFFQEVWKKPSLFFWRLSLILSSAAHTLLRHDWIWMAPFRCSSKQWLTKQKRGNRIFQPWRSWWILFFLRLFNFKIALYLMIWLKTSFSVFCMIIRLSNVYYHCVTRQWLVFKWVGWKRVEICWKTFRDIERYQYLTWTNILKDLLFILS